jgi:hypothetical protein
MATTKATDYVVRLNTALNNRKELHRRGYPSIVSGGGVITPPPTTNPLVVTLTTNNPTPAPGATATLTATVTGGTSPYTPTWTPPAGVTLSGSGLTRTFVVPTTTTSLTFRVSITDSSSSALVDEATVVVTPIGAVAAAARWPGHVPNRVIMGMATSGPTPGPDWAEARAILAQPVYEVRNFTGNWISQSGFDAQVLEADQINGLPWVSFKEAGTSADAGWQGIRNGQYDNDLISLFNMCKDYAKPVLACIHHEPAGDGNLTYWAQMNEYCAYFFAGYRDVTFNASNNTISKGAYNAANDLSLNNGGNMAWAPIGNGHWWRNAVPTQEALDAWPASVITALNACKGVLGNDVYDADYNNEAVAWVDPNEPRVPVPGGVRTSTKMRNFINWCRARGVNAIGIGEYGCIDGSEMIATWGVIRSNRDILGVVNYFNSIVASRCDWRLIPATYPDSTYVSSKGLHDFGGDAQSAGRLAAFKTTLTESISAQYTSPL